MGAGHDEYTWLFGWGHGHWEEVSGRGMAAVPSPTLMWSVGWQGLPCALEIQACKCFGPSRWCLYLPMTSSPPVCTRVVYSPHLCLRGGLFTGFCEIHSHEASKAWLMSQKMRRGATRRPGAPPASHILAFLPIWFLLSTPPPGCSWDPKISLLCCRDQARFSQLLHRKALRTDPGTQQNKGPSFH